MSRQPRPAAVPPNCSAAATSFSQTSSASADRHDQFAAVFARVAGAADDARRAGDLGFGRVVILAVAAAIDRRSAAARSPSARGPCTAIIAVSSVRVGQLDARLSGRWHRSNRRIFWRLLALTTSW